MHVPAFQLTAYPALPRLEALHLARQVLDQAGARLQDVNTYSSMLLVLQVALRAEDWPQLMEALAASPLRLEPTDAKPAPALIDADGDTWGTLALVLPSGAPDRKDIIPAVPG